MECLKDWNEAALHFAGCYLLTNERQKKTENKVCFVTYYNSLGSVESNNCPIHNITIL